MYLLLCLSAFTTFLLLVALQYAFHCYQSSLKVVQLWFLHKSKVKIKKKDCGVSIELPGSFEGILLIL